MKVISLAFVVLFALSCFASPEDQSRYRMVVTDGKMYRFNSATGDLWILTSKGLLNGWNNYWAKFGSESIPKGIYELQILPTRANNNSGGIVNTLYRFDTITGSTWELKLVGLLDSEKTWKRVPETGD